MSLTDITVPYEILVRFDPAGAVQGAHQQRRRIITLDGEVIKDDVLPAEALGGDFPVSAVMSAAEQATIARMQALEASVTYLTAVNAELAEALESAQSVIEAASANSTEGEA